MPKKKTALTIEERLQQALVPAEEQPYELPENWVWCRLGAVNQYNSKSVNPMEEPNKIYELYSVPSMIENYPEIISGYDIGSTKQAVCENDVLLCKINPRINRVWKVYKYTDNDLIASSEWIVIRNDTLNSGYLMFCLQAKYFREILLSNVSGVGGSLMRAQPKYVRNYPVPLPPLAEQQRIVDRIEELFAKLDEAKEKLQEVVDSFAVRKATILHRAFTGELTQKWRKENGVELSSWEEKSINTICRSLKYGTSKKSSDSGDVIVLRMGNLQNGEIDWNNLAYTNDKDDIEKYSLKSGDVLFNRTNSPDLVGKTSIYRGEYPAIYAGYLIKLDYYPSKVIGEYLNYYLNSPSAKEYYMQVKTDGVSQSNINAKKIGEFITPLPPLPEQHEIVRLIDSLLARERKAQQTAKQALANIELMKKAILAKAFRGELGTNKASEASAVELLRQVLAEEK